MRFASWILLTAIVGASALTVPGSSHIQRRQDGVSSVSYDYWWPYGPNGVYATTSAAMESSAPSSTMIWWTPPPTPAPTIAPSSVAATSIEVVTDSDSITASSTGDSSNSEIDASSPTSTSDSDNDNSTDTMSSSSGAATATFTSTTDLPTIRIHQPLRMAYFIPVFLFSALALAVAVGMIVTRCGRTGRSTSVSPLPSLLGGHDGDDDNDDEKQNLRSLHGRQEALVRGSARFLRWLKSFISLRPIWLSNRDDRYTTLGDLGRRRLPPISRLATDGHENEYEYDRERWHGQDGSYGYGQWMTRRGMMPVELTREYSREGDAEEVEIDLSKGWRHFSSLYGGSPDLADPQEQQHASPQIEQEPTPRQQENRLEAQPADEKTPTKSRFASLMKFPIHGITKSFDKQSPSNLKGSSPESSANRSIGRGSPTTSTAINISSSSSSGIRRTSAGNIRTFSLHDEGVIGSGGRKHKREAEIASDELSLNSRPYSLCDYRGNTPPPTSRFKQQMHAQTQMHIQHSLSPQTYDDLYSTNSSPDVLLIERTPRQPNGDVRHKSIRRLIVEKLRGGGSPNDGLRAGPRYAAYGSPLGEEGEENYEASAGSTPMVMGVSQMLFSDETASGPPTPVAKSTEPLKVIKSNQQIIEDPFHHSSPLASELIHSYEDVQPDDYKSTSSSPSISPPKCGTGSIDPFRRAKGRRLQDTGSGVSDFVALKRSSTPMGQTQTPHLPKQQKMTNSRVRDMHTNPQRQIKGGTVGQVRGSRTTGGMSRMDTSVSTVPSAYSPATTMAGIGSPSPVMTSTRQKSFKAFSEERKKALTASSISTRSRRLATEMDVTSAAQMSKLSRKKPTSTAAGRISSKISSYAPSAPIPVSRQYPLRAQSPLPDLPSGIMSPPLQAELFFSPSPSVDIGPSKWNGKEREKTQVTARAQLESAATKSGGQSLNTSSTMETRRAFKPPPTTFSTHLRVSGAGKPSLARTASRATTSTSGSTPPPPSHFSFATRARANVKVDMIVKSGYVSKERPNSPTGFGAKTAAVSGERRVVGGGVDRYSATGQEKRERRDSSCSSLDVEGVYGGAGIEQRLGL
ncbi:hypothetical protein FRB96_009698 [Tulasnella sp. 330]|nr:hypothetical protein FRB96_009698 [Tulasnella sp. 330]